MEKLLAAAIVILGAIALIVVLGLLIAIPVMLLWNWLMPELFNLPTLTYWQAYGLLILCSLLFKSSGSSSSKS